MLSLVQKRFEAVNRLENEAGGAERPWIGPVDAKVDGGVITYSVRKAGVYGLRLHGRLLSQNSALGAAW